LAVKTAFVFCAEEPLVPVAGDAVVGHPRLPTPTFRSYWIWQDFLPPPLRIRV